MMKYFKSKCSRLALFLGTLLLWTACAKDKGNYDYNTPHSVQMSADMDVVDPTQFITADSIDIRQNDNLKIKLKLTFPQGNIKQLSYHWYITQYAQAITNPEQYLLDTTSTLDKKITLAPNLYKLVAKLTDKETGISFYKSFALNVSVAEWGGEGWMVLHEGTEGADISVITTRDATVKGKIFHDVYSTVNGHKLPVGTFKVNVINYVTNLRAQKVSFLYPKGALQVRSTDFADSSRADSWFAGTLSKSNFQTNGSAGGSSAGWEYVIVDNQLSYRQFASAAHIANPPLFFPLFEGLKVAPFVINAATSDPYYTLYDISTKGFTLFNATSSTLANIPDYKAPISNLDPLTGQGFDLKNIGDNLIYAENVQPINASSGIYWNSFFRNDGGTKSYLIQFPRAITYRNEFTTGRYQLTEENCPGIHAATLFANPTFLPLPGGVFYYVNGAQIYTAKVNVLAGTAAQPNLTFPTGTIIKAMKVFNSGYTIANIAALGVPEGKVLVVATDESASAGGHHVYFFNIDAQTGQIKGTVTSPADKYSGFEKITDIVFKKALGR